MAENGLVTIATTTSSAERVAPNVDPALYRVTPQYSVASIWNSGMIGGAVLQGNQKRQIFNQYDQLNYVTLTSAATAGDTTLNVVQAGNVAIYSKIYDPRSGQTIKVTAQPSSPTATTLTVEAITYNIPARTRLVHTGWGNFPENYPRTTPISRNANKHYEYTSGRMFSTALTWAQEYTKQYGPQEVARIEAQALDTLDSFWNNALLFDEPVDGTNTGVYSTAGIVYMGHTYNRLVINGAMTQSILEYAVGLLKRYAPNGRTTIKAHTSEYVRGMFGRFGYSAGLVRMTPENSGKFGTPKEHLMSSIPGVSTVPVVTDVVFDDTELKSNMYLVNWANIDPIRFGQDELIKPTADYPNGAADRATGARMWQWRTNRGWSHKIQIASVVAIEGITSVQP